VLSRKVGEQIQIGDDILLTVVAVDGNKVRLGIQAPRSARILRGELMNRPETLPVDTVLVVDVAPNPANG
jgi:carbon storage regulator